MGKNARADFANPLRLNTEHLDRIGQYFRNLTDTALADRIQRFLVDGTGEEVLLELGGRPDVAETLAVAGQTTNYQHWQHLNEQRLKLLRTTPPPPPEFCMRVGQVIDALLRARSAASSAPPKWPAWLVVLVCEVIQTQYWGDEKKLKRWSADDLARHLPLAGLPDDALVPYLLDEQALISAFLTGRGYGYSSQDAIAFPGPYLQRNARAVRDFLTSANANQRALALQKLAGLSLDATPLLDLLVELATGTSKAVRESAGRLLVRHTEPARPLIEKVLVDGNADQRHEAGQLLWRLYGKDATQRLEQHLETESAERVQQTIRRLLAAPNAGAILSTIEWDLPAVNIPLGEVPLPDAVKPMIAAYLQRAYQKAVESYEQQKEQYKQPGRPSWMQKPVEPPKIEAEELAELIRCVEGRNPHLHGGELRLLHHFGGSFADWLEVPGVELVHVVRIAYLFGILQMHGGTLHWWNFPELEICRSHSQPPFGLREFDRALTVVPGYKPLALAENYLANNNKYRSFCDWEDAAIWPIFTESLPLLRELLNPAPKRMGYSSSYDYSLPTKRTNAFRVLGMFPQLPAEFVPVLWEIALSESKADRPLAQKALASVPDKTPQIIVALADGKQTVRAAAADWLGRLGDATAIEPIKAALRAEKQEAVKGAQLIALDRLGAEVEEFLDRKKLLDEAETGLAKKRPKGMEWVPLEALPALHWQDTGALVDPRIVQWWVVQAVQQKSPLPGPITRRYLALCRSNETAGLAKYLLSAWIGKDTTVVSKEEAAQKAKAEADRLWALHGQHQYYRDHYQNSKDNLYRELFTKFSTTFTGSANDQKGMLALVAAAGDADCVKMMERYIREWFGNRLAQCKALLEVLAWVPNPLAIQVLLTIANRFRTKALRQLAQEHVEALAEREGWTIDELADRTIPDAGFARPVDEHDQPLGDDAILELDYGPRKFQVRLNDDLEPIVTSEEGKPLKNVPAPGKNDDVDKAKAAKKAFSDAKKAVKEVVKRQTERFYEALCTQRSWRFEDWQRYLARHPIVGRLCVRLAWSAFARAEGDTETERFLGCFRPLEDGSLTNEKDETFPTPSDAIIRLAHTCNTPADLEKAWQQHFADYEVEPLFQQFDRPIYALPADKKNNTQIKDFEGHMLSTFKLRGKATRLGYVRGAPGDGGWFSSYQKSFPSLGLEAVIEFTGSPLPEEDRACALIELSFQAASNKTQDTWTATKLPLSKIPPVLLSEVYNDMRQLAAEGTGHDPEWQKKGYY